MSSYYDILDIDSSADSDAIKSAYRKMAKKYHPDTNHNDASASDKFREVKEAYETLSDSNKRASYDRHYSNSKDGYIPDFEEFDREYGANGNFWKMWDDVKRKTTRQHNTGPSWGVTPDDHYNAGGEDYYEETIPLPPKNKRIKFVLEPEEFYKATIREIKYSRKIACNVCEGFGTIGNVMSASTCSNCKGERYVEIERNIKINIPKDSYVGSVINYPSLGNQPEWGKPAGDLLIEITEAKSSKHISVDVFGNTSVAIEVNPIDAMLGCTLLVPFPSGVEKYKFNPMEIIENQDGYIVQERGILYDSFISDHIIVFEYTKFTAQDIEMMKKIKNEYGNNKKKK